MLANLLWYWEAKMQYDRQRVQGLAGLIGLLSVVFFVWKWEDWFYPLFYKLGLVGLAERTGLVHDLGVVTVLNVIAIIVLLCIFIGLIILGLLIIGMLLLAFGLSKFGQYIMAIAFLPVVFILYIFNIYKRNKFSVENVYKHDPELKILLEQYSDLDENERNFQLYLKQLERNDSSFSVERDEGDLTVLKKHLNKVLPSLSDHSYWRIVYLSAEKQFYLMFPNPLPALGSKAFQEVFTRKGPYGFESLRIEHLASLGKSEPRYHVLALPISIEWDGEKFDLLVDAAEKLQTLTIYGDVQIYQISSIDTDQKFMNLLKEKQQLYRLLKRAHLAFYIIPMVYSNLEGYNIVVREFITKCLTMPNREEYYYIYENDIRKEIIHYSECGESWAINLIKRWNSFG